MYIYYHIIYIYIYIIYVWSVLLLNNVSHGLASGTHQTGVRFGPAAQSPCVGGLPAKFHQVQTLRKLCNVLSRALEKKFFSLYIYIIPWHSTTELLYFWLWFNALRPPAAHCHVPSLKGPGVVVELVRKFPTESRIVISLISVIVISMTSHWHKSYFNE